MTTPRFAPRRLAALAIALAAVLLAGNAFGGEIAYSLWMSEDLDVLQDPHNEILQANVARIPQHELLVKRTNPFFELTNTSETALITQLSMSIGQIDKNFDWGKLIEASPGVTFTLETPDAVRGGVKSDQLVIKFTDFEPGDFVRFRVGLTNDNPSAGSLVDFRTTFFQLSSTGPTTGNSVLSIDFLEGENDATLTETLENFEGPRLTATTLALKYGCAMDTSLAFNVTGTGIIGGEPIPEPASLVLAALAMGSFVAVASRRRLAAGNAGGLH